jgi:hypothetical protein
MPGSFLRRNRTQRRWIDTSLVVGYAAVSSSLVLEHESGGAWHAFRRGWATARKPYPLKDVAAAGGWRDTATLLRCYQHADPESTLAVVMGSSPPNLSNNLSHAVQKQIDPAV